MATSYRKKERQEGITLLITLLLMGVLLGISASLLNITLKQYQLSGIALSSEIAFQSANAGLECVLYRDFDGTSPFEVPTDGSEQLVQPSLACMGASADTAEAIDDNTDGKMRSGEEQRFEFTWDAGSGDVCSSVSVYKFSDADNPVPVWIEGRNMRDFDGDGVVDPGEECPAGSVCTVVQARGYNVGCSEIITSNRVVEREYTLVY